MSDKFDNFGSSPVGAVSGSCPVAETTKTGAGQDDQTDKETTFVNLQYNYADGTGVPGAEYTVESFDKSWQRQGTLDDNGYAEVTGIPSMYTRVRYYYNNDPPGSTPEEKNPVEHKGKDDPAYDKDFVTTAADLIKAKVVPMPHGSPILQSDLGDSSTPDTRIPGGVAGRATDDSEYGFFPMAADSLTESLADTGRWSWGFAIGDWNRDPDFGQIGVNTAITVIPFVDPIGDARDVTANLYYLLVKDKDEKPGWESVSNWVALLLTILGCIPAAGSVAKGIGKAILRAAKKSAKAIDLHVLLKIINRLTKINGVKWLKEFSGNLTGKHLRAATRYFKEYLNSVIKALGNLIDKLVVFSKKAAASIRKLRRVLVKILRMSEKKLKEAALYLRKKLDYYIKKFGKKKTEVPTGDAKPKVLKQEAVEIKRPLGRGSTADASKGSFKPRSLREKLAVEEAMANPSSGNVLPIKQGDPRWHHSEGWVKKAQNIEPGGGAKSIEVHYVENTLTGEIDDFKIIDNALRR